MDKEKESGCVFMVKVLIKTLTKSPFYNQREWRLSSTTSNYYEIEYSNKSSVFLQSLDIGTLE